MEWMDLQNRDFYRTLLYVPIPYWMYWDMEHFYRTLLYVPIPYWMYCDALFTPKFADRFYVGE